MAKKASKEAKTTKEIVPHFENGMCITCSGLYVDIYGIAWWVDPHSRTFSRVA